MQKIILSLIFLLAITAKVSADNSIHHVLYSETDFIHGSSFRDFAVYDSSNFNVELTKNFGGFELDILGAKLDYKSQSWGVAFSYTQSGQEDLEMYGNEATTEPLGKFGVYTKLYSLEGYYRILDMITVYLSPKIKTYKVIDHSETDFYGSAYLGTENFKNKLRYRAFVGVWNYTPNEKSVGNLYLEADYKIENFVPKLSADLKYYSRNESVEAEIKASIKGYDLISLFIASQVTGNNAFSAGLSAEFKGYGVAYDIQIFKEDVDPIHKIVIQLPIF